MLQEVDLSNNRLSGTLPNLINYCQDLMALDLSNNSLSGPLPNLVTMNRIKVSLPDSVTSNNAHWASLNVTSTT